MEKQDAALRRLRALARLMDDSIPVPFTRWRVGLDAVIGLVPGAGDWAGVLVSAYLLLEAAYLRAPLPTLARMVGNVALEAVFGVVPVLGDLFDAAYKANVRNVRLLEQHLGAPGKPPSRTPLVALAVLVLALLAALGYASFALLRLLAQWAGAGS